MDSAPFRPAVTSLEDRTALSSVWSSYWYSLAAPQPAPQPAPAPRPAPAPAPVAVAQPAPQPAPAAQVQAPAPAALPAVNQGVLDFARGNLGNAVDVPNGSDCYDLANSAVNAAGGRSQWTMGTAGPIGDHYVWGDLQYRKSLHDGYGSHGDLGAVLPGDVVQMERFTQVGANGSWATAYHHTAVVESVDQGAGRVNVLQQNWNGNKTVQRGAFNVNEMTAGVLSVYRPQA